MALSRAARKRLKGFIEHAERTVWDMARERGGGAQVANEAGHYAHKTLAEVAEDAAKGERLAVKALKLVRDAKRLGEKNK
jgi:hypothetical protein